MTPLALLRLDAPIVERLRREDGLGELARVATIAIVLGAGAYGIAFGLWRAPLQALFGAMKLPLVLLGVALVTAASSAVLAPLLGARLRPMQAIVSILSSLAVTSSILGALAPVSILFVLSVPAAGTANDAAIAQSLVLTHTLVIAVAGTAGVLALLRLLAQLVPSRAIAKRVVIVWMATQLLVGAQLSWLLRPFLGRPGSAVTFFSPDALEGGFFDEILRLADARFGALAPFVLGWLVLMLAFWIGVTLMSEARLTKVKVWPRGLEVTSTEATAQLVAWPDVLSVVTRGELVVVRLARDRDLVERSLDVLCGTRTAAQSLASAIESARASFEVGPYR